MANLYLGLVHYPIYNKNMQVIATAVTNFCLLYTSDAADE